MSSDDLGYSGLALEASAADSERVAQILEVYLAELEAGAQPDVEALIAQHPDLAEVLRASAGKLEMLHHAAACLRSPSSFVAMGESGLPSDAGRLGDFNLLREIGRGGMGIVYEALQVSLGRRVALKVLAFAAALDARQLQRFKNEAQAAALLHHPHIVPVYAVGADRGVHYYAMQFIEGQSLAALIDEQRSATAGSAVSSAAPAAETPANGQAHLSTKASSRSHEYFRNVARLGVQAALALEHAHQLGVVHRDIKPANLLVDAQAHLWITDFGLARCQAPVGLTHSGDLIGTLRYMSPEQALARHALVGPRSDVYSLGATLYEMLTLQPPYTGQEKQELLKQIAFEEPQPPRHVNSGVPFELETIVLKALAKEPEGRYVSAQELADDLGRFLEQKPILARRPTWRDRLFKWSSRHRQAVLAGALVLVLASIGLGVSTYLVWREKEAARLLEADARASSRRAEANFRLLAEAGVMKLLFLQQEKRWGDDPKVQELRKASLETGLAIFQKFLDDKDAVPAVHFQAARTCNLMADIYCTQHNFTRATQIEGQGVELLERLVADFPADPAYRERLAIGRFSLGYKLCLAHREDDAAEQFARAEAYHRAAVQDQASAHALHNYAVYLLVCPHPRFHNLPSAAAYARRAVALEPSNGVYWSTLGWTAIRMKDWQIAIDAFQDALRLHTDSVARDQFGLAIAYCRQGKSDDARSCYDHGVQELNKNAEAAAAAEGAYSEATALLKKAGEHSH